MLWAGVTFMLPYLGHANLNNTIGVQNGTLYDILNDNNGTGNVTVGAKSFNVTCGSLPNVTVNGLSSNANQSYMWYVDAKYDSSLFAFTLNSMGKKFILLVKHLTYVFGSSIRVGTCIK
jgi:hypothetical protein